MEIIGFITWSIILIPIYFIPAIVGRRKKHETGILLVNLFLGWTGLGLLAALIWAMYSPKELPKWVYDCPKCGFQSTLNQKVKLYVCPQCKTETPFQI